MFKSIAYILNPLFIFIAWSIFFYSQKNPYLWVVLSLLSIIVTALVLSGNYFWRHKLQWFNFLVAYLAQFAFLLMLKNVSARYWSAFVLAVLWAFTWWMLKSYFKNYLNPKQVEYLSFKKYWYILNLWFLSASAYSLIIFLSLDFYYFVILVSIVILAMAKDLFGNNRSYTWDFWALTLFFFAQIFAVVYFLPVSFYVGGTLVVLWFYYFVSLAQDDKKKAKWPILIILSVTLFLLLSSLYIIL